MQLAWSCEAIGKGSAALAAWGVLIMAASIAPIGGTCEVAHRSG
jgi:hypothetical protein